MKAEDILARVRYDLPETGKIVVGLSGGADSVLLTYLLVQKYGAERLLAVHVHHGIRGAEADRDAEFVQDYCKALELHCKVIYKDIPALAAVSGEGVEECARRVRYACFAEEAGENGCIATAHNADDNADTRHGAARRRGHSAAARQNLSPDFEHFPRRGGISL